MTARHPVPVFGFAAYSGTGKTTLLRRLLPLLRARGLRVAMVKHAHHGFDTDIPGKDSYELRRAGAAQMLIASYQRWALVSEIGDLPEPSFDELLARLDLARLDLVLVEGFKAEAFPKIELHRPALGHPLLCAHDPAIVAIAADAPLPPGAPALPRLDLNRPEDILGFLLAHCGLDARLRQAAGTGA